jgi:sirohydrochlorin ferrochelatase
LKPSANMVGSKLPMAKSDQKTAVILLAHGTREPDASKPVHDYARALARATGMCVEPCLREFIEPGVSTVVRKLADGGYRRIVVVPFFLFQSGHVTRDIQDDLAAEKAKFPHLTFDVGEPIGYDDAMVDILKRRLEAVIG